MLELALLLLAVVVGGCGQSVKATDDAGATQDGAESLHGPDAGGVREPSSVSAVDASARDASRRSCVPGETQPCFGPGRCEGAQSCEADGRAWSTCDCGDGAAVDQVDATVRDASSAWDASDAQCWDGGCVSDPGTPILRNGDFEDLTDSGTFFAFWSNNDGNPDGQILMETEDCYSGQHCLLFSIDATGDGWEYFVIQNGIDPALLEPGRRYAFRGAYKLASLPDADDAGGDADISFNYILRGSGLDDIGNDWDNTHPSVAGVWQEFAFAFTIPANAAPSNYELFVHLIKWTGTRVELWVDDLAIVPVD